MALNYAVSIVGVAVIISLPEENRWGRFAGVILALGYSANFPLLMSLVTGNFGGFTKKTTVNAIVRTTVTIPFSDS